VFPRKHEFTALVMDRDPRRHLTAISLWGESHNLESRIERVAGMYFLEKLAGGLSKRDEHVSDVLRKKRCPGSREREYLQAETNSMYSGEFGSGSARRSLATKPLATSAAANLLTRSWSWVKVTLDSSLRIRAD
jgi:hypothetical protein